MTPFDTGIIPAYAGNTFLLPFPLLAQGDHPRICGEHFDAVKSRVYVRGSSPHMRGTLAVKLDFNVSLGIIPAYAGNTMIPSNTVLLQWDHPRICGEHYMDGLNMCATPGSSPHMRGTRAYDAGDGSQVGIIPAYAGNTWSRRHYRRHCRDHPRICGEHCQPAAVCQHRRGSSPHMRGTLLRRLTVCLTRGIIPAYAGNTSG